MATQIDPNELNLQEQMSRIREMIAEADRRQAEAEQRREETRLANRNSIFQAMIATGALLAAGATVAKVFFP